jgi:hypothetical protein
MNMMWLTDSPSTGLPINALASIDVTLIPLVAIVMPFIFVICIVGFTFLKDYRTRKLQQETIRYLIDKGQPIPPEMMQLTEIKKPKDDRRNGIILIAVGISLYFFLNKGIGMDDVGENLGWCGLIPGLIGVAMLINWMLEHKSKNKNDGK